MGDVDNQTDPSNPEDEEKPDPKIFRSDLYAASMENDTDKVLHFLNMDVPPTYIDPSNGFTPLHWAAMYGNVLLVKKLLDKGANAQYLRAVHKAKQEAAKTPGKKKTVRANDVTKLEGSELASSTSDGASSVEVRTEGGELSSAPGTEGAGTNNAPSGGAYSSQTVAESKDNDGVEDENDEARIAELKLEKQWPLNRNTPLLWACSKCRIEVVWILLAKNYSPNDLDISGNNALHLAAAQNNLQLVKLLVDCGTNANKVNIYKNAPISMASDKEVRHLISSVVVKYASLTNEERESMQNVLVAKYKIALGQVMACVPEAGKNDSPRDSLGGASSSELTDALHLCQEWSIEEAVTSQIKTQLKKLDIKSKLEVLCKSVESKMPIITQHDYVSNVYKLETAADEAELAKVDSSHVLYARDVVLRCQVDYSLFVVKERLKDVTCAVDAHEHDMNKLKGAISKSQVNSGNDEIVLVSIALHKRLCAELGMSRAILNMPAVKLPPPGLDPPPADYWGENDIGKIDESNPEYPLPPAETNEYVWIPSTTLRLLRSGIVALKECFIGADELGANPAVIAESKDKLVKAEKDLKILEAKDAADKLVGIDTVTKLAKKLKKGKKK